MTAEKLLEHQGTILLAQSDGCAVWQFRNETGDGTITTYEIFSGVMLAFNDFHMERYECDFVADRLHFITLPYIALYFAFRKRQICKNTASVSHFVTLAQSKPHYSTQFIII